MPAPALLALAPLLTELAKNGLSMIGDAILSKGKDVVEEKLGVKIPDDPKKLTPELLQQLTIRQMEHEEFLVSARLEEKKLELEEHKTELADRSNARDRDKELIKQGRNNQRGDYLAYGALGALILDMVALSFFEVPRGNRDLLLVILGALIAIVKDVYGFEFGSSKSNERNSQELVKSLRGIE